MPLSMSVIDAISSRECVEVSMVSELLAKKARIAYPLFRPTPSSV